MTNTDPKSPIRLGLPKGRMQEAVLRLLADAGIHVRTSMRGYRPQVDFFGLEAKILKPQNIVAMLHHGSRDIGFAGADWVAETNATLVEVLDTHLNDVTIVAAAPHERLIDGRLVPGPVRIASEYERLTRDWIAQQGLEATFVRSHGATEVFPPEDADAIVDNTATGSTLRANGLAIFDTLMRSSTRLYAHPRALDVPQRREVIENLTLLLRGVLDARQRVMLEVNVARADLEAVVARLPSMREPTVAPLHHEAGFAVKAAVPRDQLPTLIPKLKQAGATDILVTELAQIVP